MDNTVFRQTAWQKEDNETYYLLKHSHTKNVCAQNYKYEDCDEITRRLGIGVRRKKKTNGTSVLSNHVNTEHRTFNVGSESVYTPLFVMEFNENSTEQDRYVVFDRTTNIIVKVIRGPTKNSDLLAYLKIHSTRYKFTLFTRDADLIAKLTKVDNVFVSDNVVVNTSTLEMIRYASTYYSEERSETFRKEALVERMNDVVENIDRKHFAVMSFDYNNFYANIVIHYNIDPFVATLLRLLIGFRNVSSIVKGVIVSLIGYARLVDYHFYHSCKLLSVAVMFHTIEKNVQSTIFSTYLGASTDGLFYVVKKEHVDKFHLQPVHKLPMKLESVLINPRFGKNKNNYAGIELGTGKVIHKGFARDGNNPEIVRVMLNRILETFFKEDVVSAIATVTGNAFLFRDTHECCESYAFPNSRGFDGFAEKKYHPRYLECNGMLAENEVYFDTDCSEINAMFTDRGRKEMGRKVNNESDIMNIVTSCIGKKGNLFFFPKLSSSQYTILLTDVAMKILRFVKEEFIQRIDFTDALSVPTTTEFDDGGRKLDNNSYHELLFDKLMTGVSRQIEEISEYLRLKRESFCFVTNTCVNPNFNKVEF